MRMVDRPRTVDDGSGRLPARNGMALQHPGEPFQPDPGPMPPPGLPDHPPIEEPDPDTLPDEAPNPNPDESPEPEKHAARGARLYAPRARPMSG